MSESGLLLLLFICISIYFFFWEHQSLILTLYYYYSGCNISGQLSGWGRMFAQTGWQTIIFPSNTYSCSLSFLCLCNIPKIQCWCNWRTLNEWLYVSKLVVFNNTTMQKVWNYYMRRKIYVPPQFRLQHIICKVNMYCKKYSNSNHQFSYSFWPITEDSHPSKKRSEHKWIVSSGHLTEVNWGLYRGMNIGIQH